MTKRKDHQLEVTKRASSSNSSALRLAVSSFKASKFKAPWWAKNNHLQTILSPFFPIPPTVHFIRERMRTSCGDFFDVDIVPAFKVKLEEEEEQQQQQQQQQQATEAAAAAAAAAEAAAATAPRAVGAQSEVAAQVHTTTATNVVHHSVHRRAAKSSTLSSLSSLMLPPLPPGIHSTTNTNSQAQFSSATAAKVPPLISSQKDPSLSSSPPASSSYSLSPPQLSPYFNHTYKPGPQLIHHSIAIVCHGLESSSFSAHSLRIVHALNQHLGWPVYALNFRGCSGEKQINLPSYHVGFYEDLERLVRAVAALLKNEDDRIYLVGFSAGGSVVANFLGRIGTRAQKAPYKIGGACTISCPYGARACVDTIDQGFNKWVYVQGNFLRSLKAKAAAFCPSHLTPQQLLTIRQASTMKEYDRAFTVPVFGFTDLDDYIAQCDPAVWLPKVDVPFLLLTADDDPFIPLHAIPTKEQINNDWVKIVITRGGGHGGYFDGKIQKGYSYMGNQAARFFAHVDNHHRQQLANTSSHIDNVLH